MRVSKDSPKGNRWDIPIRVVMCNTQPVEGQPLHYEQYASKHPKVLQMKPLLIWDRDRNASSKNAERGLRHSLTRPAPLRVVVVIAFSLFLDGTIRQWINKMTAFICIAMNKNPLGSDFFNAISIPIACKTSSDCPFTYDVLPSRQIKSVCHLLQIRYFHIIYECLFDYN